MQFRTEPTLYHHHYVNPSTDPFCNHPTTTSTMMMIEVDNYYSSYYDYDPLEYDSLECKSPLALSSPPSFLLLCCFFFFFFFSIFFFSIFRYYFNKFANSSISSSTPDEQQPAAKVEVEAEAIVSPLPVTGKFMIME